MNLGATLHDLFGTHAPVAPGLAPQPTGDANPVGVSLAPSVVGMMNQAPAPAPMSHGHFLLGVLADALAGAAGKEGPFAAQMARQQQAQAEEAQWTRRQASELQQHKDLFAYEQANKAPEVDPVTRDANAFMGLDAAHRQAYQAMHPGQIVNMTLPNGQFYSGPAEGVAAALGQGGAPNTGLPRAHQLTPLGGAGGNVSGGFRR